MTKTVRDAAKERARGTGRKEAMCLALLIAASCARAAEERAWRLDAGADFRLRQEIMGHLPGMPGDGYSLAPTTRAKSRNQIRMRPRAWIEAASGPYALYLRIADEMRHYPTLHGSRHSRAYYFPDEVFLDNLYLEGRGIESDALSAVGVTALDFRLGRQDLFEGGHSVFGLDRLLVEGTATDGSRSFYADMARARLHFGDAHAVDAFALYDSGRSDLRVGTSRSRGRSLNCVNMSDDGDLDEWGGGLVYSGRAGAFPFKVYAIFKRAESHTTRRPAPRVRPAREITTLGVQGEVPIAEELGVEYEAGKQFGRILDGNRQAGGWMAHAELKWRPAAWQGVKGVVSGAATYYSGDRHRTGDDDNDTGWDPLWGRYTQDSEMLVYGSLYENCRWTNVLYAKAKVTMSFGRAHGLYVYSGPMFAAERDGLGHADGGGSRFMGVLSAARYDMPVRLAPKGAEGLDRVEVVAHVVAEVFNPGGYYESRDTAFFFRWQVDFRF